MDKEEEVLHLYLEELNEIPIEYSKDKLQSKGFFESITVQDFPIRGHVVYLHIKRRRWLNLSTDKVVFRIEYSSKRHSLNTRVRLFF
ncbi:ISAon1 family transposase N-terminal region protein [Flavobacterium columnare]